MITDDHSMWLLVTLIVGVICFMAGLVLGWISGHNDGMKSALDIMPPSWKEKQNEQK
jgi:hypothetical protein